MRIIKPPAVSAQLRMSQPFVLQADVLICVHCLGLPDFACDIGLHGQAGQADGRNASLSLYPQEVLVLRSGHLIVLLVMVLAG